MSTTTTDSTTTTTALPVDPQLQRTTVPKGFAGAGGAAFRHMRPPLARGGGAAAADDDNDGDQSTRETSGTKQTSSADVFAAAQTAAAAALARFRKQAKRPAVYAAPSLPTASGGGRRKPPIRIMPSELTAALRKAKRGDTLLLERSGVCHGDVFGKVAFAIPDGVAVHVGAGVRLELHPAPVDEAKRAAAAAAKKKADEYKAAVDEAKKKLQTLDQQADALLSSKKKDADTPAARNTRGEEVDVDELAEPDPPSKWADMTVPPVVTLDGSAALVYLGSDRPSAPAATSAKTGSSGDEAGPAAPVGATESFAADAVAADLDADDGDPWNSDLTAAELRLKPAGIVVKNHLPQQDQGVGVWSNAGLSTTVGVRAVSCSIGFVLDEHSTAAFTRCSTSGCAVGCKVHVTARTQPTFEQCHFRGSRRHGIVVTEGQPWLSHCSIADNANCGAVFEAAGSAVLTRCSICRNGTQGVFARSQFQAPQPPLLLRCDVYSGGATGIKSAKRKGGGAINVCETRFFGNADHDIEVQTDATCTAVANRFCGGGSTAVVVGQLAAATLIGNSFAGYSLWGLVTHDNATVTLNGNVFSSDVVSSAHPALFPSAASGGEDTADEGSRKGSQSFIPASRRRKSSSSSSMGASALGGSMSMSMRRPSGVGAAGCSGILLQKTRGSAEGNLFLGWSPGIERGRTAFCLVKCLTRLEAASVPQGVIPYAELDKDDEPVRRAVAGIASRSLRTLDFAAVVNGDDDGVGADVALGATDGSSHQQRRHADPFRSDTLRRLLAVDTAVRAVDLSGNATITDDTAAQLAQLVSVHPSIATVSVAGAPHVTAAGFTSIADAASVSPGLESVDAAGIAVDDVAFEHAIRAVEANPRLRKFRVSDPSGTVRARQTELQEDLEFFCMANTAATTDESRHQLQLMRRDDAAVTEAFFDPRHVRACDDGIDECSSPFDVVTLMGLSLKRNTHVATVQLSKQALDASMLRRVGEVVSSCASVTSLGITDCGVRDAAPLTEGLLSASAAAGGPAFRLVKLDLRSNDLRGPGTARALAQLFGAGDHTLEDLNLRGNPLVSASDIDTIIAAVPILPAARSYHQRRRHCIAVDGGAAAVLASPATAATPKEAESDAERSSSPVAAARPRGANSNTSSSVPRSPPGRPASKSSRRVWQPKPLRD